ncbi:MAG TPA: tRNA 2-thiouridine(34) synthase MnmA [Syntrophothermus lipocalidus]|nr:tRNA 2-thiouridine(34) synthase MnmA [Syntrophothermus lipocalidus]
MSERVAVLMSGGVDSGVAALLLKEQGYDVIGLTMLNWSAEVCQKAAEVARFLGVSHHVVDLRAEFKRQVIDYFCRTYEEGLTPNPCVVCNEFVKFGLMLEQAWDVGCRWVATGHYARVELDETTGRHLLKKGVDPKKDQSYFLYRLKQNQLCRLLFPLGNMTKQETKSIAAKYGLPVAKAEESQEVCFIEGDYRQFLAAKGVKGVPGPIRDQEGNVLGTHQGLISYTVGQRRGLGLRAGRPFYVIDLDTRNNTLVVGEEKELYRQELLATDNNFIPFESLTEPLMVEAKIRYTAPLAQARLTPVSGGIKVEFVHPQRAVTRGQSVVYYQDDVVLGGGIIA